MWPLLYLRNGTFDMSVGINIVLSSIIACNASEKFGYAGLIIAPLICGTIIGLINGIVYIKLHISSLDRYYVPCP